MGIIKRGILGGFSGKVANVVGTSWKGRAVIKSLPLSVANPRTDSQVSNRNVFSAVSQLASLILSMVVRVMFNPIAGNVSGFNKFQTTNAKGFDANGEVVEGELYSGGGQLISYVDIIGYDPAPGNNLSVEWTNQTDTPVLRLNDKAIGFAVSANGENVWAIDGAYNRGDTAAEMTRVRGEEDLNGDVSVTFCLGFVSEDGREVSVLRAGETFVVQFPTS